MSHTSTVSSIVIVDVDALKAAIAELKSNGVPCELLENMVPRAYYPNQQGLNQPARYILRLNGAPYDVAFYQNEAKSGYEARADFFGGGIEKHLGVKQEEGVPADQCRLGKLYNLYAVHATMRQAVRKGYKVSRVNKPDGSTVVVAAA